MYCMPANICMPVLPYKHTNVSEPPYLRVWWTCELVNMYWYKACITNKNGVRNNPFRVGVEIWGCLYLVHG